METNNLIELIHNDFDTSVDVLLNTVALKKEKALAITEKSLESDIVDDIENGKFLDEIGFNNTKKAVLTKSFYKEKSNIFQKKNFMLNEVENIENVVQKYQKRFPFYKFILLSQVLKICEKYDLYIGHSSLFIDDIPAKNIQELKDFPKDIYLDDEYYRVVDTTKPLFVQLSNPHTYNEKKINYYICASYNMFNTKDKCTHVIGKEIFKNTIEKSPSLKRHPIKAKDPIILIPVKTNPLEEIGFLINTKWGKEAEDSNLVVPINN